MMEKLSLYLGCITPNLKSCKFDELVAERQEE